MQEFETTQLIDDAKHGEKAALNALFERCAPRLMAYVRYRVDVELRSQLESADLLQEVLLRAFLAFDSFQGSNAAQFLGWLTKIAQRQATDIYRYHRRERRDVGKESPLDAAAELAETRASALTELILSEQNRLKWVRFEKALDTLPLDDAKMVVMHELEERTFPEIGADLQMREDAVRQRVRRGLGKISVLVAKESP